MTSFETFHIYLMLYFAYGFLLGPLFSLRQSGPRPALARIGPLRLQAPWR
jgi:hypothetical protein